MTVEKRERKPGRGKEMVGALFVVEALQQKLERKKWKRKLNTCFFFYLNTTSYEAVYGQCFVELDKAFDLSTADSDFVGIKKA